MKMRISQAALFSTLNHELPQKDEERWLEEPQDEDDDEQQSNLVGVILSYVFLFGLIFGLSATVEIKNLKKQLQNKFAIFTGVTMQFVIMPALGFVAVKALEGQPGWTKEMGIALLVVTSSPGGSYSNWWCSLFNADLALSVAMTTVSSLLSMAMLPLNLFLYTFLAYGTSEEDSVLEALDFETIFLALGIVLLAISSGLFAGYKFDNARFHVTANRVGSCSGVLLVLFSLLLSSGADGAKSFFWNQSWAFYVGVAFPCVVGLVLSSSIANALRLAKPETVAIAIECCYQNTGIATSVAIAMYEDKEVRAQAVAVPLFYGAVEALVILLYCIGAWKFGWTKAPANERLCVILAKTYELDDEDESRVAFARHVDGLHLGDDDVHDTTIDDEEVLTVDGTTLTFASQSEDAHAVAVQPGQGKGYVATPTVTPPPFWKRWLAAAFAGNNNKKSSDHDASSFSSSDVGGSSKSKIAVLQPRPLPKNMLPTSSLSSSGRVGGGVVTKKAPVKVMIKPALPPLTEADDDYTSGPNLGASGHGRNRSFTVETTASSGPPTTPAGRRDLVFSSFARQGPRMVDDGNDDDNEQPSPPSRSIPPKSTSMLSDLPTLADLTMPELSSTSSSPPRNINKKLFSSPPRSAIMPAKTSFVSRPLEPELNHEEDDDEEIRWAVLEI